MPAPKIELDRTTALVPAALAAGALLLALACTAQTAGSPQGEEVPAIVTQPQDLAVDEGQAATFAVVATGAAPLAYQWSKDGVALPGATQGSYTTPATTGVDGGSTFSVVVSNGAGSATSRGAVLTVNAGPRAPAITSQPEDRTVNAGQAATFSVSATGTAPLGYQWSRNGTAIAGATGASYTTGAAAVADAGARFTVRVSNAVSAVTSREAILTVVSGSTVRFAVDTTRGPTPRSAGPLPVSPYVYGINHNDPEHDDARKTRWTLYRAGGDNYPAWNWAANYSNHGANYCFWQGLEDVDQPTGALSWIPAAAAKGIAALVTAPVGRYVAARVANQTWPACDSVSPDTNVNGIPYAPSSYFASSAAAKGSAFCLYPGPGGETTGAGASCTLSRSAAAVYQDEFASYLKHWYADAAGATVFVSLDNEPNYWHGTHPELWASASVTYDDILGRDEAVASAIKAAWPAAKIFGPVVAQDGIVYAHDYTRSDEFLDYYLPRMSGLLDVLDVHYYNSGRDAATCLDSPRAFWDPTYTVPSGQDGMTYIEGNIPSYLHRQMIPRLLDKIAAAGMSPVPGLAFTEYDCGCEGQIAGGIAQADMLGLFGRWGVYAATAWLNARNLSSDYAGVAFDLYRNYDGAGATVGELAVSASTSDEPGSALYAFAHAGDASKLELVALNRRATSLAVHVAVATAATFGSLARYHLVAASPVAVTGLSGPAPVVSCSGGSCGFDVTLEPSSATVLVLR
jgi:hypothetical protein